MSVRRALVGALVIFSAMLGPASAAPASSLTAGSLDPTYGSGGSVLDDFYGTQDGDQANAIGVQPDGKIVVTGSSGTGHIEPIVMTARYNANGTRDLSFGPPPHGFRIDQVCFGSCGGAEGDAVAVMPNGDIVVAGVAVSNAAFFVMRLTPSGALDSSFAQAGGNAAGVDAFQLGAVTTGYHVGGVAVQPDGKIVVDGTFGSTSQGFVARVVSGGGALDTSGWNPGLGYSTEFSGSTLTALALQPSNQDVVVAGTDNSVSPSRVLIARFTPAGAGDATFNGGSGYNVARIGSGSDTGAALVATSDGRLIVAGTDGSGASGAVGLFQFAQSTGTLDPSFGGGSGEERVTLPGGDAGTGTGLALDPSGRLLVAGQDTTKARLYVTRLLPTGSPDGSFGSGGFSVPTIGTSSGAQAVTTDAAGNPVVAGFGTPTGAPDTDALTARLLGATPPGPPPGGGGGPPPPTAPTLTNVKQSHLTWREGTANSKLTVADRRRHRHRPKAPVGTTISFTLNEAASVRIAFTERSAGRRVHGKCVAQTRRNRHKRSCTRALPEGAITLAGHAGSNAAAFDGVLGSDKKLPRGHYTATLTASASGLSSRSVTLSFTIIR
jgi:uncharacterized delta-60 repeat protein